MRVGLCNHLDMKEHKSCLSKLEGSFTKEIFINIAGHKGIYLQEGKHYTALSSGEQERVGGKKMGKRKVKTTASPTEQPGPSTISCTIETEEKSAFPVLNFQDLMTFEDWTIFGEAQAPLVPQLPKVSTPVLALITLKGAASPTISIKRPWQ